MLSRIIDFRRIFCFSGEGFNFLRGREVVRGGRCAWNNYRSNSSGTREENYFFVIAHFGIIVIIYSFEVVFSRLGRMEFLKTERS